MHFGKDFFKILNFAIAIIRLFAQIFGNEEDKQAVQESKVRTASDNADDIC